MPGQFRVRLRRMHRVPAGAIERQQIPGLVAALARHDADHAETLGTLASGAME